MNFIPWRLIIFLLFMVLVTFFAGFNLQPVDISVGFYVFKNIPLFLALIFFFILGALIMVPFTILGKASKRKELKYKEQRKKQELTDETVTQEEKLPDKENNKKKRNKFEAH